MEMTESGIVTAVSNVQAEKAKSPISSTESGIETEVNPQQRNGLSPLFVSELGIVTISVCYSHRMHMLLSVHCALGDIAA